MSAAERPGRSQRPRPRHYLFQSLLAFVFMAGLLFMLHEAGLYVVVASLASTAFLIFARPCALPAKTRNVLGGHWLSMAVGGVLAAAATYVLPASAATEILIGALAVGTATLVMTVTDTEHAPAAGTALAMVLNRQECHLVIATVVIGSVFLAVVGRLLRGRLRDLT